MCAALSLSATDAPQSRTDTNQGKRKVCRINDLSRNQDG